MRPASWSALANHLAARCAEWLPKTPFDSIVALLLPRNTHLLFAAEVPARPESHPEAGS